MADQFVRFKAVNLNALGPGRLARHLRGDIRSEHTREGSRTGTPPVSLIDERTQLRPALEAIDRDARKRAGEKGRRPAGCYECMFTGPNRYDGLNGAPLSEEQELAWARACMEWLRERLPAGCVIANSYLHRDESSPHLHVTIVPWCDETECLDWRTVRARMAGMEPRGKLSFDGLLGKTKEDGTKKSEAELKADKGKVSKLRAADKKAASEEMTKILDLYHEAVSVPFGIGRGDRGNKRRHRAVDRRIAAELEAQGAEEKAKHAKFQADMAELQEEAAAKRANAAKKKEEKAQKAAEKAEKDAEEARGALYKKAYVAGKKKGVAEGRREERISMVRAIREWAAGVSKGVGDMVERMLGEIAAARREVWEGKQQREVRVPPGPGVNERGSDV